MMRGFAIFYGKHRIIAERSGATPFLRSKCIISQQGDASLKIQGLRLDLFTVVLYNKLIENPEFVEIPLWNGLMYLVWFS